jgi:hypothetical protein
MHVVTASVALTAAFVPAVGHGAEPLPGRAVSLPPAASQPWPSSMLGTAGPSYLPPGGPPGTKIADAARQQPLKPRAEADLPAVAWQAGTGQPCPYLAPAAPLGYAVSPDARFLVPTLRPTDPDGPRADAAGEPSLPYSRRATLGVIPSVAYVPPAAMAAQPRAAEAALQKALHRRPCTDLPSVAWQSDFGPANLYLPPTGPPGYAASPDAARITPPWRDMPADIASPDTTTDAVPDQARRATLAMAPKLRQTPAPYLRLTIPDPLEPIAPLRFDDPPPDRQPPATVSDYPPRPVLPVIPPAKPTGK